MQFLSKSRFNPKTGVVDLWQELRKPVPYRWPILIASTLPIAGLLYYLAGEKQYKAPERPQITYITTFEPDRADEEIAASNLKNQELKELREARDAELEQRKRDLYKALGAAAGMDVDEIDRRGEETRAAEAAARQAELDKMMGRADSEKESAQDESSSASESSAP